MDFKDSEIQPRYKCRILSFSSKLAISRKTWKSYLSSMSGYIIRDISSSGRRDFKQPFVTYKFRHICNNSSFQWKILKFFNFPKIYNLLIKVKCPAVFEFRRHQQIKSSKGYLLTRDYDEYEWILKFCRNIQKKESQRGNGQNGFGQWTPNIEKKFHEGKKLQQDCVAPRVGLTMG